MAAAAQPVSDTVLATCETLVTGAWDALSGAIVRIVDEEDAVFLYKLTRIVQAYPELLQCVLDRREAVLAALQARAVGGGAGPCARERAATGRRMCPHAMCPSPRVRARSGAIRASCASSPCPPAHRLTHAGPLIDSRVDGRPPALGLERAPVRSSTHAPALLHIPVPTSSPAAPSARRRRPS
jgi:hypothetical protein